MEEENEERRMAVTSELDLNVLSALSLSLNFHISLLFKIWTLLLMEVMI